MLCSMSEASETCQILRLRDWIVIVGVAMMIIVIFFALLGLSVLMFTRRSRSSALSHSCIYCKDPERQPLLSHHHRHHDLPAMKCNNHISYPEMKRTSSFYQWNKPSFPHQNGSSSPSRTGTFHTEYCWHLRREVLLKRYAAA